MLIGGGGHCRSCIDVIEEHGGFSILGLLDRPDRVGSSLDGYRFIGSDDDIGTLAAEGHSFLITVGQVDIGTTRERLFRGLKEVSAVIATVVSPRAHVSRRAEVGEGTIVMHMALVNAGARIGANCILNTKALVEHDASVGDHCHISTAAIVNGGCRVGNRVFIASNCVLCHGVSICDDVVLGAGSVVTRDVTSPGVWFGNPARRQT